MRGAVVMGGPMSPNDTEGLPGLADEIAWLARAVAGELPVLGVCLGARAPSAPRSAPPHARRSGGPRST